jgi:hypothetical protein
MTSLWDPIPIGVGEDGDVVEISMPERNVLIGGEPGAGKSVAISMLVAAAALDPYAHLSLFDGKHVELAVWRGCAEHFVAGPDLVLAVKVLREVRSDLEDRYLYLLCNERRKITKEDTQFPLRLLAVDLCRTSDYADGANPTRQLPSHRRPPPRPGTGRDRHSSGRVTLSSTERGASRRRRGHGGKRLGARSDGSVRGWIPGLVVGAGLHAGHS